MKKLEGIIIETAPQPDTAVIWMHGLGADGNDFAPIVPELNVSDLKIRFIFPHAPVRPITMNNNMPMRAWFNIENLDRLNAIDLKGLMESFKSIELLIQEQKDKGIPANRIILAGFSQGGSIALLTSLLHAEALGGVIFLSSFLPIKTVLNYAPSAPLHKIPVFMAHGIYDNVIPIELGEQTRQELMALGYKTEWHQYPMPHSVCIELIQEMGKWFHNILGA
jgi:phospholipase/carboxylesterase